MKSLPNVTLISYDNTNESVRTLRVLQHCASMIQFAAVVLVCRVMPPGVNGETIQRVSDHGYATAMIWEVAGLKHYIETDFALCVHHDGYLMNPQAWRDEWLQYDFIGAPWPSSPSPYHPGKSNYPDARVGNTGFCLKSKAFMDATNGFRTDFIESCGRNDVYGQKWGADTFTGQIKRTALESLGMKYAPVDVASQFSWESNIEEVPGDRLNAFGFHNFSLENKKVARV